MNLSKLIAAHREFGRRMGGLRYEDIPLRTKSAARDEQVAEWIELSAKIISAQPEPKMDRGRPESGTRAAARELGIEKEAARRAVKVASLTDEAKQAAREVGHE